MSDDKWISVDDKLPTDAELYLVWCRYGGYALGYRSDAEWMSRLPATPLLEVTHWRELPPSPLEEAGHE